MKASTIQRRRVLYVAVALVATSQPIFLGSNALLLGVLGVLSAFTLWEVLFHQKRLTIPPALAVFIAWAALSVAWSEYRESTLVAALTLLFATVVGAKAATFGPASIMRGLQLGALLALVASLGLAVAAPSLGLVTDNYNYGALQGIYSHRNTLGAVLAVGFAATACRFAVKDGRRLRIVFPLAALAFGVAATQSSSALATSVLALAVAVTVRIWRAAGRQGRTITVLAYTPVILFSGQWVPAFFAWLTEALGRDLTLTGRTLIWESVWRQISEKPLVGHGWGAVWHEGMSVGDTIRREFHSDAANTAHNGFLDIWLHLGLIGLGVYAVTLAAAIYRCLNLAVINPVNAWGAVVIAVLIVYNLTESRTTAPNGQFLTALVACAAYGAYLSRRKVVTPGQVKRYSVR